MSELVSVIVPVFNVIQYLDECLSSISEQTYHNLEIIVINDGSTDGCADKCDLWTLKDNRVKVIHQENKGVSAARNTGIAAANGAFITFVDADDWLDAETIEKLVDRIKQHHADMVVYGFINHAVNKHHNKFGCETISDCDYEDAVIPIIQGVTGVCNKLYRRETIYSDGSFIHLLEDISYGEDEIWLFEVLSRCKKITFLPEPLYHWRARNDSMTKSRRVTEKTLTLIEAKKKVLAILPLRKDIQEYARAFTYYALFTLKVTAYCEGNTEALEKLNNAINEMNIEICFNRSEHIPQIMKIKNRLLCSLLNINANRKLVSYVENIH